MKGVLANLLIKLGLDNKEFNNGLDDAKKKTNIFADGIKRLGGMMAAAFSVAVITSFIKSAVAAGKEQIKVENELGAAIRANGKDVESNLNAYKAFASQLQRNSTVGDETTLSLIRLAETMQSKAPMEATKNAIALSKALGIDLNTAIKMAVMAQSDMYTMLGRYVPALRTAGTEAERTAEYNKLLASGMQMVSDELNTAPGKIIQNENAWGDLKERLGAFILQSKIVSFVLNQMNDDLTISNSSLKWYEKWWYRITLQHGKGAKIANERADAEAAAAATGVKNQTEFNNLLGEITINSEEYNKRAKEQKEAAIKAWEKENEEIAKQVDLLQLIDDNKRKALSEIGAKAVNSEDLKKTPTGTEISAEFTPNMFALSDEVTESIPFDTAAYQEKIAAFNDFKNEMQSMVADFGVDVVEQFGESLGEMIATGNFDFSTFGQNVLAGIGGFLVNLGKMMIQFGIASEAFQTLLKNIEMPGAPLLLIAAGAGLVLLGGMIKGAAKAGPAGAGAGSSGSISAPSYSKANYSNAGMRAEDNKVIFEIKGDRLVGVLANTTRKNGNIR